MIRSQQVVCAGGAVADLKLHLAAPAVLGSSNPATVSTTFGGVARNVAENLAILLAAADPAVRVQLVSAVGDDAAGRAMVAQLRDRSIGTQWVRVVPGEPTAQYVALLEPGGGLTIAAAVMGVLDRIGVADLDAAWPDGGWLFCDANLGADVLAHVLARARSSGTWVAMDAVSVAKVTRLPADLRGLALLSCTVDEAQAWLAGHGLAPSTDDHGLAARLHQAGAGAVLLTRGARGLVLASAGTVTSVPAVPATVLDVTGAGDALIGGTLAALIQGAGLNSAVRAGTARAAATVASTSSVLTRP